MITKVLQNVLSLVHQEEADVYMTTYCTHVIHICQTYALEKRDVGRFTKEWIKHGHVCNKALICAISVLSGTNGLINMLLHIVGPPLAAFKAHFSATSGWYWPRDLVEDC